MLSGVEIMMNPGGGVVINTVTGQAVSSKSLLERIIWLEAKLVEERSKRAAKIVHIER